MSEAKSIQRPRVVILGLAAITLAGVLLYTMWPAATPVPPPSNQPRVQQRPVATSASGGPGELVVRLDDLKQPPPQPGDDGRNPFRFYVPPPPPPKPPPPPPPPVRVPQVGDEDYRPPPPPPPPPIPLKFIGTMEQGKKKVAIFSDGKGVPMYASEGELVLGQYRVVRIGIESVVMEYADGKGRQTIPMRG
jgi:hypothetical protein